jgi:glycosyltransferase involved in cell wall biosynthesis
MRFALLHHGDPLSPMLWSGIPLNIADTLRTMGHYVKIIGNLTPRVTLTGRLKGAFYKQVRKKMYLINRDPAVMTARARCGNLRLKEAGQLDAVLITYPPDAAYLETDIPILILHDAAWTQLVDFYPGTEYDNLATETLRGGIELDKAALSHCKHAIYSSQWAVEGVVKAYGVPRSKLSVAALGSSVVNPPQRAEVQKYLERRLQEPMKLFFLGRDWYRKGGDIAVAVATQVEALGIPVELHVAGCAPNGMLPAWVKIHGPLSKDIPDQAALLRNLFETSDFFIMPSRADAFGMVYGEAAVFGMPVIASNVGGVPEAVCGEWGITPRLDTSAREIAEWAASLYHDRVAYERLAWLARESYETCLNWQAFCSRVVQVASACGHSSESRN